jgi:hypothetical protein
MKSTILKILKTEYETMQDWKLVGQVKMLWWLGQKQKNKNEIEKT